MPSPTPSAYVGRDLNPAAISVRVEYADGLGMDLAPGDGGLTVSARPTGGAQKLPVKDRGTFDGFVLGEYVPVELAITLRQLNQTLTQADAARLADFFDKAGYFEDAVDVSDVPGTFKAIVTYADKSTRTYAVCEGEFAEAHAFPSNTLALTIRSHGAVTVENI